MSVRTNKAILSNVAFSDKILDDASLDNIVENDELTGILSNYITKSQLKEFNNEIDPHFQAMSSDFALKSQLDQYLRKIEYTPGITAEEDPVFQRLSANFLTAETEPTFRELSGMFVRRTELNDLGILDETDPVYQSEKDTLALKEELPTNYLSVDAEAENEISSYNEFYKGVCFEYKEDTYNGPLVMLNADKNCHFQLEGTPYTVPNDVGYGPGKNIADNTVVKTWQIEKPSGADTVSSELIATRRWTNDNFAKKDEVGGGDLNLSALSALTVPVGIRSNNLSILTGNYLQTSTRANVYNLSERNGFVQAEAEAKYGQAYAGTMGYCIVGLVNNNTIRLSGDLTQLYDFFYNKKLSDYPMVEVNDRALRNFVLSGSTELSDARFSIALGSQSGSMRYQIASIDTSTSVVTFRGNDLLDTSIIPSTAEFSMFTQEDYIDLFNTDDNGFYLVGFPMLGNIKLKNFYGQHAEGGSVRAVGKYTHAEGRDNVADARYSHAEGSHNAAGDMAAHAEGFCTYAAKRYSHAEGFYTKAMGVASHAAGIGATALSNYTYVWNGAATDENRFDTYVQPAIAGRGSYCINPNDGLCGFFIGDQSMHTYMVDLSSSIMRSQNPNVAASTGPVNGGRSFEESLSVNAYINAGALSDAAKLNVGNRWNQIGTGSYNGKIIKVSPGDIISFKLMPWKNPIDGTSTTYQNYWSAYIKPLSSFNYDMDPTVGFNAPYLSALSANGNNITFAQVDMSISSEPANAAISDDWNYFKYPINQAYPVTRIEDNDDNWIKTTNINGFPISSTEFELSVTIPANTHFLYVCTKQGGNTISYESFKINGHELITKKADEKSKTINAFNADSPFNLRHRILSSNNVYGIFSFKLSGTSTPGNNYMLTHPIPCKYHDHIIVSQRYGSINIASPLVRGVQYLDKEFNSLYMSFNSSHNNGFDKGHLLTANGCSRCTLSTVTPVQFKDCAYVRLAIQEISPAYNGWVNNTLAEEFPNDASLSGKCATMVQIVHESEYSSPGYKFKDHDHFIPFIKDTSGQQGQLLVPDLYGKKLVFFGDSITRNSVTASNDNATRGDSSDSRKESVLKSYVNYVSEALRCSYTNLGDGADTAAVREGHNQVTGIRTSLAWRLDNLSTGGFPAVLSARISAADAAFILIGTNDWTYTWTDFGDPDGDDVDNGNFCGAIRKIQQKLDSILDRNAPIVFCTPIKRKRFGAAGADIHENPDIEYDQQNGNGKTLADYAEAIKKICNGKRRTYVVDLYNLCPFDPKIEADREKYLPDGTHPLSRGHKLMADLILKKLRQIMDDYAVEY